VDAQDLPAIAFADSGQSEVGDVVLAIGNPFAIGQTVTMGIISATGRASMGLDYEDFIQTDAAINPGNSGGALVDAEGRLIGINTAIYSRSGGNQGIGFAIPTDLARGVMVSLIEHGKVTRGYLGVRIQTLTPLLAKEFNLKDNQGALVGEVEPNGPADKAGLTRADASKLLQAAEYQHGYSSRPALAEGPSSKVIDRGMMGKGMTDMTLVLFPCQTFLCLFSLVSGRSQILHFVAVRVKLDASALHESFDRRT
jgi:serine protease Do